MQLISEFEIQYLSPIHHGYPAWPGGERWLQLYQLDPDTQIVLTKGLRDGITHLFEVYLQTDDQISTESFSNSWQANLIYEIGKIIPNVQDLSSRLEKNGYLTVQIEMDGAPPEWSLQDRNGNIGLFIGLQNLSVNEHVKPSVPLNIKLMRPKELQYSIENGFEGRMKLAELYGRQGKLTISNLERLSVIDK